MKEVDKIGLVGFRLPAFFLHAAKKNEIKAAIDASEKGRKIGVGSDIFKVS